jgi:hypothetical protein
MDYIATALAWLTMISLGTAVVFFYLDDVEKEKE